MATKKLSQITPAAPAGLADQVVGVSGGDTDALFSISQVGLLLATSNVTFYVSPSGNDSTAVPGNASLPYKTAQAAVNAAANYNWDNKYIPTFSFAHGTYTAGRSIQVSQFANLFENFVVTGDNSSPTSVVFGDQWEIFGPALGITIGGVSFTGAAQGSYINLVEGMGYVNGPVVFGGNATPFYLEGLSFLFIGNTTITVTATTIPWFVYCSPGVAQFQGTSIVLPAALTVTEAFAECDGMIGFTDVGVSLLQFAGINWTNFNGVTGAKLIETQFGWVATDNAALTDLPGSSNGFQDSTSVISAGLGNNPELIGTFALQKSGTPAATDVPQSCWRVIKDTSGGGVYVAYNDAGTIKKVALT